MTINDLIERLEQYRDEIGGDAEIRLMTQQNWPFENEIAGLASGVEINDECDEEDPDDDGDVEDDAILYIVEADAPMNVKSMIEAMQERGYWTSPGGKTPHATLYSAILREIKTKGKDSRFQKADRGQFTVKA